MGRKFVSVGWRAQPDRTTKDEVLRSGDSCAAIVGVR